MARQTVLCCSAVFGALLALVATPSTASAARDPEPVEVCSKALDAARLDPVLDRDIQSIRQALRGERDLTPQVVAQAVLSVASPKGQENLGVTYTVTLPGSGPQTQAAPAVPGVSGICIRTPFGPGRVHWDLADPQKSPNYFSVLPETSSKLIWAKAPDQPIDAIYRRAWGNCSAWKVPDSADVWVKSATKFEICQNAAAAALGHYVRIATTCKGGTEPGWPDNPL